MTNDQIINSLGIVIDVLFGFSDAQGQRITESRAQDAALMGLTLEKIRHELSAECTSIFDAWQLISDHKTGND